MTKSTEAQIGPPTSGREGINRPIRKLSELGLKSPQHLTVGRFLELLVDEGLLTAAIVDAYLHVLQEARFGDARVVEAESTSAVSALEGAIASIDPNDPRFRRLISTCAPPPPPEPPKPLPVEEDEPEASIDDLQSGDRQEEPQSEESEPPEKRWDRRRVLTVGLFTLWTVVMLIAGHFGGGIAAWSLDELNYQLFGGVRGANRLEPARARAVEDPESRDAWATYVEFAQRHGRWAEAVAARRHLVVRNPDDAQLLNALAWLLCTAEAAHVRDPVEALELAERAYALDPTPNITDTLAEAAFQNGDIDRAIALEQDALQRIRGDNSFYVRQLEKFKAASGE